MADRLLVAASGCLQHCTASQSETAIQSAVPSTSSSRQSAATTTIQLQQQTVSSRQTTLCRAVLSVCTSSTSCVEDASTDHSICPSLTHPGIIANPVSGNPSLDAAPANSVDSRPKNSTTRHSEHELEPTSPFTLNTLQARGPRYRRHLASQHQRHNSSAEPSAGHSRAEPGDGRRTSYSHVAREGKFQSTSQRSPCSNSTQRPSNKANELQLQCAYLRLLQLSA